jgi:hypothetical protein
MKSYTYARSAWATKAITNNGIRASNLQAALLGALELGMQELQIVFVSPIQRDKAAKFIAACLKPSTQHHQTLKISVREENVSCKYILYPPTLSGNTRKLKLHSPDNANVVSIRVSP